MECVKAFNSELSSLYDVKPPISKAKMTGITKSAIKGIKFYKHIVQSVEKFIQKCRPEYKVPGLYVIDSIVRQSRHQFGADKDVFGPRFTKNITTTFQHLFKCVEEDRSRIIRVLNLWQKNNVFPSDVIQPLLDMGHLNASNEAATSTAHEESRSSRHKESNDTLWKGWPQNNDEPPPETRSYLEMIAEKFATAEVTNAIEDEMSHSSMLRNQVKPDNPPEENTVKFKKELLDFDYGDEEDDDVAKNEDSHLSNQPNALALSIAQNLLCHPDLPRLLHTYNSITRNLLSNPDLMRELQQVQETIQQNETFNSDGNAPPQPAAVKPEQEDSNYGTEVKNSPVQQPPLPPTAYQQPGLPPMEMTQSEADKDDRILPQPPLPPKDLDERSLAAIMTPHRLMPPTSIAPQYHQSGVPPVQADKDDRIIPDPNGPPRDLDERSLAAILAPLDRTILPPMPYTEASSMQSYPGGVPFPPQQPPLPMMEAGDEDERVMYSLPGEPPLPPQDFDERSMMVPVDDRGRKERSRSRSGSRSRGRSGRHRSRSRSPRRKRSRSRSPSRKNRSRSKEQERIREKEREREKERDRKRKGIPPIKKGCVSVCSTTLWIGHVPKSCTEVDISNTFAPYGTVLSIDMIPPRGCAYVVMDRRQDGHRVLQKLKNVKLQGSVVKMAWAPGKGVKGKEYKEYWEVGSGVSYVPFEKIPEDPEALDMLEEGGFIDEESLPEHLKALRRRPEEKPAVNKTVTETSTAPFNTTIQAPPMVPPPIIPPTSVNLPMLLPHPMQPQFGLHLPGLLPPQAMVMQVPMGIPPPNPMMMVQQQSQGLLGSQTLPLVGGVPPLVPRTVPPLAGALQGLKSVPLAETAVGSPMIPISSTGDATPTEEDGTNVSSPSSVQKSVPSSIVSSTSIVSTQSAISVTQFNPLLGLPNTNRPMLSVPPPVSASGTPIPYPPPNVNFSFPPPGMRPPGQHPGMPPNSQFPWLQKPSSAPFTEADTNQARLPQAGLPPHMFNTRPPFPEIPSVPSNQTPVKDVHNLNSRESCNAERQSSDMDISGNRSVSPSHQDKMPQEMVISTDDESSMDRDYPAVPRFPTVTEFSRMPMNMHRMRGPPGPMQGARFPPNMPMGGPFPPRMGGPRGMMGPGMHPGLRMEMDFHGNPGIRPRMPIGPHSGRRGDPQSEGRDWYPRDFDGPPYERDRRYHDDRSRDSWTSESQDAELRHGSRSHEIDMRDDRSRDEMDGRNRQRDQSNRNHNDRPSDADHRDEFTRQKPKPVQKNKIDDLLNLRFYQRDKNPNYQNHLQKQLEKKKTQEKQEQPQNSEKQKSEQSINVPTTPSNKPPNERLPSENPTGNQVSSGPRRDRESRKRSRWGRTLSEEREFQQQKRTEIEMKFQSYEQSAQAAQLLNPNISESSLVENSTVVPENVDSNMENVTKETEEEQTANVSVSVLGTAVISDQPVIESTDLQTTVADATVTQVESEPTLTECVTEPQEVISEPLVTSSFLPPSNINIDQELSAQDPAPDTRDAEPFPKALDTEMLSESSDFNMISEHPALEKDSDHISNSSEHLTKITMDRIASNTDLESNSLCSTTDTNTDIPSNSLCPESSNDVTDINICQDSDPTKDSVDISSVNKSPMLLTES